MVTDWPSLGGASRQGRRLEVGRVGHVLTVVRVFGIRREGFLNCRACGTVDPTP